MVTSSTDPAANRRRYLRKPIQSRVGFQLDGTQLEFGQVVEVSEGGFMLCVDRRIAKKLKIGTAISIDLIVPPDVFVTCAAESLYQIQRQGALGSAFIGFKFVQIGTEERESIRNYVGDFGTITPG